MPTNMGSFTCEECDYRYKDKWQLKIHVESIHEGIIYRCSECNMKFSRKETFNMHTIAKHKGLVFQCDVCESKCSTPSNLKFHKKVAHTSEVFNCTQCAYKTKSKPTLRKHELHLHSAQQYSCEDCDFKSGYKTYLKIHFKRAHHGTMKISSKAVFCTFCDHSTKTPHAMKKHTSIKHLGTHSYSQCDNCEYKAQDKHSLKIHQKSVHEKQILKSVHEKQILKCNFCDYKCRHRGTLTGHIRVKHLDEGIKCDQCQYMSAWKKDMREHKREVHDRYISICPILGCTYQVKSSKSFKKHTMKHGIHSEGTKGQKDNTVHRQTTKLQTEIYSEENFGSEYYEDFDVVKGVVGVSEMDFTASENMSVPTGAMFQENMQALPDQEDISMPPPTDGKMTTEYLCPVSSCTFIISEINSLIEEKHLVIVHNIVQNKKIIKL